MTRRSIPYAIRSDGASLITATESTSGESILLSLRFFSIAFRSESHPSSIFLFCFIALPQLGLGKLLGPSIHVAKRGKRKEILLTYCVLWCKFLNSPFPAQENSRGLIFFSIFAVAARKERLNTRGHSHMTSQANPNCPIGSP